MGFLNFNSNKKPQGETVVTTSQDFLSQIAVGDRDLSKPFIDDHYVHNNGMVYFGHDNLYPNLLNNLYLSSSIHSTCVNFKTNTIIGGGWSWKDYDSLSGQHKMDLKSWVAKHKFNDLIEQIAKDWVKHNRVYILLKFKEGKVVKSKLVDPANVRNDSRGIFKDVERYFISDDFSRGITRKEVKPYHMTCKDEWQMLELTGKTGGSMTYSLPDYIAAGNWLYLDGEVSYLYKQGIVNSINPSMIFKFPFETTPEVKSKIRNMLTKSGKGAKNMGRVFTFFKEKEQQPEIETVKTTNNDKLYSQTSSEIKDNIAIAHQLDPSMIGVKVAGKLGNSQELRIQYEVFEKNWVIKNRRIIQEFVNKFAQITEAHGKIEINRFSIIDDDTLSTQK